MEKSGIVTAFRAAVDEFAPANQGTMFADLLRLNDLEPVYHGEAGVRWRARLQPLR